eukprot:456628-Rhodomonas_salina.3
MQPSKDQLVFYKVGGPAQDAMPNAPAFDSADSNDAAAPSSEPPASSGVLQAPNTPDSAPDQPSAAGLDQAVSESDHTPTAAASASAAETETAPSRTTSSGSAAGADAAAPKKNANSKAASARTVVRSASSAAKVDQSRSMAPPAGAAATGAAEDLLRSNIAGRCSEAEAYARMGMRRGAFEFGKTRDTGQRAAWRGLQLIQTGCLSVPELSSSGLVGAVQHTLPRPLPRWSAPYQPGTLSRCSQSVTMRCRGKDCCVLKRVLVRRAGARVGLWVGRKGGSGCLPARPRRCEAKAQVLHLLANR